MDGPIAGAWGVGAARWRVRLGRLLLLALLLLPAGCTLQPIMPSQSLASPMCPVTPPNGNQPPGESVQSAFYYGNGELWTALWPGGVVLVEPVMVDDQGRPTMKWPWWRGLEGELVISGQRIDAESTGLWAVIPDGYESTGFQPSRLIFDAPGCWEVTARVADAELVFVTEVRLSE